MFKHKFKCTKVGCLDDIVSVVQKSAKINYAQLVGDQQGNIIVPSYDCIEFFKDKTIKNALKGLKKLSHLRFTTDSPRYIMLRTVAMIQLNGRLNW